MKRLNSATMLTAALTFFVSMSVQATEERVATDVLMGHPIMDGTINIIDAWVDAVRDYEEIPGLSVGIVYNEDFIWQKSYGYSNLETERPADSNTIYSICSISKLFTSIGVMQLRDAGKLRLSDPVSEHLEWFDIDEIHADFGPATIEGLLTHSSGLPRESTGPYWNEPDFPFPTREELIERLGDQETLYPSQSIYQYSNLGITLAGEIIRETSGMDYEQYVRENILEPMGLEETRTFYPEELRGDQLAIGYMGFDRRKVRDPVNSFFTRGITPAAGFTSTLNDMARFAIWQFATLNGKENEILAMNTLREMQRVHWMDQDWDVARGLGFGTRRLDGDTTVDHLGSCPGYVTQILLMPRYRIATIVLTNAGDASARNTATNMLQAMRTAVRTIKRPFRGEYPDFSAYEGNYSGPPWGGEVAMRQKGEHLIAVSLPAWDLKAAQTKLKHKEGNVFVRLTKDNEERETWTFTLDDEGKGSKILRHTFEMYRLE